MQEMVRALVIRSTEPHAGLLLHLIIDGAEKSMCGIPKFRLGSGSIFDEVVCPDCIARLRNHDTADTER
jgi:hypothetical protein